MKINRFFALAVIALLVVGAMGAISLKVFANSNPAPATQTSVQAQDCPQDQADGTEVQDGGPDTDNIEEQCGDQNAPDTAEAQGGEEAKSADGQEAAPSGTPAITAEQAQAAALAAHPGTVVKTELDDENGQLIYSVELDGGVDVKVDAMTGAVLGTESGQD